MRIDPTDGGRSNALPLGYRLGEYTIVAVLGDGGFGITYRARDVKLGVDVAIKEYFPGVYATRTRTSTIAPKTGGDIDNYRWGLNAFLSEAQALAKFKHPQIVRVLRFLETNGTAYTIMEYEEGETLTTYLRRHGGVLGEPRLLQIFLPILNGLQAVHDAGLLHLDIKPDNIYLRRNEQPMLIDFGSSRQMRGDSNGKITLTPGYCALEQYPGHGTIGAASDVYGMGATLYRCLTGKSPIDARERRRAFDKLHVDPLPPATSFERPPYAMHVRAAIDSALQLVADDRPASAFALQQVLMGKDLAKIAARPSASLYRPGTGYIGTLPPPPEKPKVLPPPRYGFFEKLIAAVVFIATFAVIVPKVLIDTGHLRQSQLFDWVDDAKNEIVERATDLGDQINQRVFGVEPRPRVTGATSPRRHPRTSAATPVDTAAPAHTPFGADKQRAADIVLPQAAPRALGFLKHGAVLAVATSKGALQLWDTTSGTARATLPTQIAGAAALGIFPNSQDVAAADREQAIAVLDPLGNTEFVLRGSTPKPVRAVAVSSNALLLAELTEDNQLTVWDLPQQRPRRTWRAEPGTVALLAFSPDERTLLTGDGSGYISIWNSGDGTRIARWPAHKHALAALAFAADGRRLASADTGGELRIWSAPAGAWQPERTLTGGPGSIARLAFSPDGQWLIAVGAGADVYVWDAATGALAHRLATKSRALRTLAISDDGKWLAVAADDNIVRIWK